MPAAGEWTIEISPKTRTGSAVSEQFGGNFEGCLARAKSLRDERSASHHIYVHLKLTRFRGHRTVWVQGVHDGQDKIALRT